MGVSDGPEHPAMKARVVIPAPYVPRRAGSRRACSGVLILGHETLAALSLHRGAKLCGIVPRHRAGTDTEHRVAIDLGLADQRLLAGELRVFLLELAEGHLSVFFSAADSKLDREAADGGIGRRNRSRGCRSGRLN